MVNNTKIIIKKNKDRRWVFYIVTIGLNFSRLKYGQILGILQ